MLIGLRFSFAIESTLSGKTLAATLLEAARAGYYIAIKLLRVETIRVSSANTHHTLVSSTIWENLL